MKLEELKSKLEKLTLEITEENFTLYYSKFTKELINYRDSGGLGKPLYEALREIHKIYEEDDYKDEVLVDIMNRMTGYTSSHLRIPFSDLEKEFLN